MSAVLAVMPGMRISEAWATTGRAGPPVVAVGDAENDHAFLTCSGCGVAVANALPALKERADLVTQCDHGAGELRRLIRMMRPTTGPFGSLRLQLNLATPAGARLGTVSSIA